MKRPIPSNQQLTAASQNWQVFETAKFQEISVIIVDSDVSCLTSQ